MRLHSSSCRQEAHGVFSLQLYDEATCHSIVGRALRVKGWSPVAIGSDTVEVVDEAIRAAWSVNRNQAAAIHEDFEHKISERVLPVLQRVWGFDLASCEGTQLVRYGSGGHYAPHKDGDDDGYTSRYFTVLCYLNDGFNGGRTRFPSLGYSAPPVTGRALIFPSRFTHCAEPVLEGEKLILLTWLCGPVPVRWI